MKWSKLKQRIEERFADEVQGRVEFFQTRYRRSHDQVGEFWITIDGEKIHGFGDLNYFVKEHVFLGNEWGKSENRGKSMGQLQTEFQPFLTSDGLVSVGWFNKILRESLNHSIEDMLDIDNALLNFMGILDKRCGKRRLARIDFDNQHELVKRAIQLRLIG